MTIDTLLSNAGLARIGGSDGLAVHATPDGGTLVVVRETPQGASVSIHHGARYELRCEGSLDTLALTLVQDALRAHRRAQSGSAAGELTRAFAYLAEHGLAPAFSEQEIPGDRVRLHGTGRRLHGAGRQGAAGGAAGASEAGTYMADLLWDHRDQQLTLRVARVTGAEPPELFGSPTVSVLLERSASRGDEAPPTRRHEWLEAKAQAWREDVARALDEG